MVENLGAVNIGLTSEELRDMDSALSKITIAGERYPEELERGQVANGKKYLTVRA